MFGQPDNVDRGKERGLGRALISPGREGALRIGVHYGDGSRAAALGLHGKMRGEGAFPGPAFLRGNRQDVHSHHNTHLRICVNTFHGAQRP
jgi:hypothetical protein